MTDLDIILYTYAMMILFVLFGVSTFGEFSCMNGNKYTRQKRTDDTPPFKRFMSKIFG